MAQNLIQAGAPFQPQFVDVGAAMQRGAAIQGQQLQNQLLQRQLDSSKLVGNALTQNGGDINATYSQLMQSGQDPTLVAPALEQAAKIQQQMAAAKQQDYNINKDKYDAVANSAGSLLAMPKNQDGSDPLDDPSTIMSKGIQPLVDNGVISPAEGVKEFQSYVQGAGQPGSNRQMVAMRYVQHLPPNEQVPQTIGSVQGQMVPGPDGSPQLGVTRVSPAGAQRLGVSTPVAPAPQAGQVSGITPEGAHIQQPLYGYSAMQPAQSSGGVSAAPPAPPASQLGAVLENSGAMGTLSNAALPVSSRGAFIAPGDAEAMATDKAAQAQQGVQLQQLADNVPNRKAALGDMAATLQSFTPGPSSDNLMKLKALAGQFGITDPSTQQSVASQEDFNKIAKNIALQQTATLGAGTDQKLSAEMGANPNSDLSKLGVQQIIGMLKGNEDAIAAKNAAWQQYKTQNGAGSYSAFSNSFNRAYDPRVFQAAYMDAEQKASLKRDLQSNPQDFQRFTSSLHNAIANGWVSAPQTNGK